MDINHITIIELTCKPYSEMCAHAATPSCASRASLHLQRCACTPDCSQAGARMHQFSDVLALAEEVHIREDPRTRPMYQLCVLAILVALAWEQ